MDRLLSVVLESPTPENRKTPKCSDLHVTVEVPTEVVYHKRTESAFAALAASDPHKYGRLDGLKQLICDGYEAEVENRLLDAMHAYKSSLTILPGEKRLLRKLRRLELKIEKQRWRNGRDLTPSMKIKPEEEACWGENVILEQNMLSPERFPVMDDAVDDGELLYKIVKGKAEAMGVSLETQKREQCQALTDSKAVPQLKACNISSSSFQAMAPKTSCEEEEQQNLHDMGCDDMEGVDKDVENDLKGSFCDDFEPENLTTTQLDQRRELDRLNGDITRAMEYQILLMLNTADKDNLMKLRGIGPRRAELIINNRKESPFKGLQDLKRIGMYSGQIIRVANDNTLDLLDFAQDQ